MNGFREDFDMNNKVVKQEDVEYKENVYFVSTVDLGLNYRFGEGEPLWYETMIFRKREDGTVDFYDLYCDRYTTKEEALAGHEEAKRKLLNGEIGIK